MGGDLWRRVEEVYYQVLECPSGSREATLDECCAGDLELRREVESLLAARERGRDFLSPDKLTGQISRMAADGFSPTAGGRIGEYEILGSLGAGAMGEVFRARDLRLGREVALKILPAYVTHDKGRVTRFQSEARA